MTEQKIPLTEKDINDLEIEIAAYCNAIHFGLIKRGLWYRQKACGYTDRAEEAGRYTYEEALKHQYLKGEEPVTIKSLPILPYTKSLDAIQAAAMDRFQNETERTQFFFELGAIATSKSPFRWTWQLTALDWCIAFARTAKIWRFKV